MLKSIMGKFWSIIDARYLDIERLQGIVSSILQSCEYRISAIIMITV